MINNEDIFPCSAIRRPVSAWLRVTGEDARSFLQGQFTQDLRVARKDAVVHGLWLNQKGKMIADSHAFVTGENEVFLWSDASPEAVIAERLEAYIIADDVVMEPLAAGWTRTTVAGAGATDWVRERLGVEPPAAGCFARSGEAWVFRGRHGALDAWEWLAPEGDAPDLSGIRELDTMLLARARIAAGVALIPVEVGPGDLPNEAGLDESAVSYSKGCYLGQEVMARLKSMGRVRRRLLRVVRSGAGSAPGCPATLWQGGKAVGELRVAVNDGAGGCAGLAMLNLFSLDATAGLAFSEGGPAAWRVEESP
ncbi:MAG: folate-binding protein [Verrucomicrobiota bacterium]